MCLKGYFILHNRYIKEKRIINILLVVLPLLYLVIFMIQNKNEGGTTQINGVLQSICFIICIGLVMIDYIRGKIISLSLFT